MGPIGVTPPIIPSLKRGCLTIAGVPEESGVFDDRWYTTERVLKKPCAVLYNGICFYEGWLSTMDGYGVDLGPRLFHPCPQPDTVSDCGAVLIWAGYNTR